MRLYAATGTHFVAMMLLRSRVDCQTGPRKFQVLKTDLCAVLRQRWNGPGIMLGAVSVSEVQGITLAGVSFEVATIGRWKLAVQFAEKLAALFADFVASYRPAGFSGGE